MYAQIVGQMDSEISTYLQGSYSIDRAFNFSDYNGSKFIERAEYMKSFDYIDYDSKLRNKSIYKFSRIPLSYIIDQLTAIKYGKTPINNTGLTLAIYRYKHTRSESAQYSPLSDTTGARDNKVA